MTVRQHVVALLLTVLAAVLAVTVGLYALKSAWLANALRHRAIAAIERSTGGRATLDRSAMTGARLL